MTKHFIKWLAKIFGLPLDSTFEIVDNLDLFVKDKLNCFLNQHLSVLLQNQIQR